MNAGDLIKIIESKTNLKYNHNDTETFEGASLIPPRGRVFKNVVSLDFRSFYSSIIVSYNLLGDEMSKWLIEMFQKKQQGDKEAKLAMNMIYGLTKHFDIEIAKNIARIGREWIQRLKTHLESNGYNIIYSHTDNVMVSDVNIIHKNELISCIQPFLEELQNEFVNYNHIMDVLPEYQFKYIYFKENSDGSFAMNNYIGVNYDDTLVMKGNWKPSTWEIENIDFMRYMLLNGENTITPENICNYIQKNPEKTVNFINTKDLSILRVERNNVAL